MDIVRPTRRRWVRTVGLAVAAVGALTASAAALRTADTALPSVQRDTLWTAQVQRGEMVREVRARGKLVPEKIRWITAGSAGRVERSHVQSGDTVAEGSLLFELDNPALQLQAVQALASQGAARIQIETLRGESDAALLGRQSTLSEKGAEQAIASANARALDALQTQGLAPGLEVAEARARRSALDEQVVLAQRDLTALTRGFRTRIRAQREHAATLQELVALQRTQIEALQLRSLHAGVVQDVAVHEGQWVVPGDVLAKVADPKELKALLEVPQSQARDVAVGQRVRIDLSTAELVGRVTRVAPSVQDGSVAVEVALTGPPAPGARPELLIRGIIEIERIPNALYIDRPAQIAAAMRAKIFRVDPAGRFATQVDIEFGRISAKTIEIVHGALAGETFVVSDMSKVNKHERIMLR